MIIRSLASIFLFFLAEAAHAKTIVVSLNRTPRSITEALEMAHDGDSILVKTNAHIVK